MSLGRLPQRALTDVDAILDHYLKEAGVDLAGRFLDALEAAIRRIRQEPGIGSRRLALLLKEPRLRVWPVKGFPHLILYLDQPESVEIWRILHSSRDIPKHLQD